MPENPVLLPLRGFNELETPRPFKQVSPLGTRNTFRAGPLGNVLRLVANRAHAGRAHPGPAVVNVACEHSQGRGGDPHVVCSYLRVEECPHWGHKHSRDSRLEMRK
jgi:hypothetical protein